MPWLKGEELSSAHEALSELLAKLQADSLCKEVLLLEVSPTKSARPCLSQRLKNFGRSLMYRTEREDEDLNLAASGCLLNEPTLQVIVGGVGRDGVGMM